MILAVPFLLALAASVPGCVAVDGDRIYASDVAQAIPAFAALPANFPLGYAPSPGLRRVVTGASLDAAAKSQGLHLEPAGDVCFELRQVELQPETIRSAMLPELTAKGSKLELISFGPAVAPKGTLTFPRGGLQLPSARDPRGDALWRGYVVYGTNRRFSVWARVRVTFEEPQVVAAVDLAAGTPIRAEQVRVVMADVTAIDNRLAKQLDEVVGFAPRKPIRADTTLDRSQLTRVPEIAKGDVVVVRVASGAAQLIFEGKAESAGSIGMMIWVKNPASGKGFRAKVTGRGTASVTTPAVGPAAHGAPAEGGTE